MRYWSGDVLTPDKFVGSNNIFVFGSNPEGRHGMGAAKAARAMGAKYGTGRGLVGNSYALVTKNISKTLPYRESASGVTYHKSGKFSVSLDQIATNLLELVELATVRTDLVFVLAYKNSKATLNGYAPIQIIDELVKFDVPDNVLIHNSFR